LHVVLSGTQVPPVPPSALQVPLQQALSVPQAVPSPRHAGRLQTPPVQVLVQQSPAPVQALPTERQVTPPSGPKPVTVPELVVPELVPPVPVVVPVLPPAPPLAAFPLEPPQPAARAPPAEIARAKMRIERRRGRMASFPCEGESPHEPPSSHPPGTWRASEIRPRREARNLVTMRTSRFSMVAPVTTAGAADAHTPYQDIPARFSR
jgi:hypothetical protein